MWVTSGSTSPESRLATEHYKQYEDYNYITYTVKLYYGVLI